MHMTFYQEKACKFPTHFSNKILHIVNPKHNNKKASTTTFKKLATHDGEHKQESDPEVKPEKGGSGETRGGPLGSSGLSVALLQQRVLDLGFRMIGGFGGRDELELHALVFKVLVRWRRGNKREGKGSN
ncbi:hypothetical protein SO802_004724 [Lithocarpus litseifolius]|uniref:Uncharacterized protein n=1 Tax=Lithocarpus litseifolius TaxID=425828 RepID=A0AAW2E3S0_9ROSI